MNFSLKEKKSYMSPVCYQGRPKKGDRPRGKCYLQCDAIRWEQFEN